MPLAPPPWTTTQRRPSRAELDALRAYAETGARLADDPLGRVPLDAGLHDVELAAFLAAGLAVGNLKAIQQSVDAALHSLRGGPPPAGHRWIRSPDISAVIGQLRSLQGRWGSLEDAFLDGYDGRSVRGGLERLTALIREGVPPTRGALSLAVSPSSGSACKRLNLFLRWMVRSEGVDRGLWRRVSAAHLVQPVDAHVLAFARRYGLTERVTVDWTYAEQVTAFFRRRAPADPLRWDFAISHFGMMHGW